MSSGLNFSVKTGEEHKTDQAEAAGLFAEAVDPGTGRLCRAEAATSEAENKVTSEVFEAEEEVIFRAEDQIPDSEE